MTQIQNVNDTIFEFSQEIEIKAPIEEVFEGMIHRLTAGNRRGTTAPGVPLRLERRPGGRWYRDLGDDTGHLWGFVQSYRPPTLLEIFGPMFMSYPVSGHLIIRFEPAGDGTRLSFRYSAFGLLQDDHRSGIQDGFTGLLADVKKGAEA